MSKERPILMHARSIKGILEGRKTQTRRIVKPQPKNTTTAMGKHGWDWRGQLWGFDPATRKPYVEEVLRHCPYGKPGDLLWVRERWAMNDVNSGWGPIQKQRPSKFGGVVYRADGDWEDQFAELDGDIPPWRPSIHMPRWASRLTLEITNIRVERVQDIKWQDAFDEGIVPQMCCSGFECGCRALPVNDPVPEFQALWDDTNGKGAWDRNDWVWVIDFKRIGESNARDREEDTQGSTQL